MLIIVESDKTQHGIKSEVITLNFSDGTGLQLSVCNLKNILFDYAKGNKVLKASSISSRSDLGNFESIKNPI